MTGDLKKILIIGAEVQPIPPVEGGAVEHLVDLILQDNETDHYADFTVISPYTKEAEQAVASYRHTHFCFVKDQDSLKGKITDFGDLFARRFFDHSTGKYYLKKVCDHLLHYSGYDLVIVENRPLFGQHIRKFYKGRLYLHLHNDFINRDSRHLKDILGNYDRYIVISEYRKKRVLEVENKETEVLYNGVDLEDAVTNRTKDGTRNIVYVGRLVREKGVLELIRAYKRLNRQDTKLTIVGSYDKGSEDHDRFKKELEAEFDRDDIVTVGQDPNSEVFAYYRNAYVGVVPSVVNEALSLTAIEMLGSGLPVIATDAGGLPEVVDESCGMIIKREDLENNIRNALERMLNNEGYRNSLSANAHQKAKIFSKDRYLKQFKKMIVEL